MSKIVTVDPAACKDASSSSLDKRQISLTVEDCPRLVVQFDDMLSTCQACERELLKSCGGSGNNKTSSKEFKQQQQLKKDYQSFLVKYSQLFSSSTAASSTVSSVSSSNTDQKSPPSLLLLKKTVSTSSLHSVSSTPSTSSSSSSPSSQRSSLSPPGPDHDNNNSSPTLLDQMKFVLEAKPADLLNTISQVVTCIGCRTSVERFYRQLVQKCSVVEHDGPAKMTAASNTKVLDPIVVNSNGSLTLKQSLADRPTSLYSLFYLNKLLESIPKIKKNRRCYLHSLDTQKQRTLNDWFYVWEALGTTECRKKAIAIESRQLSLTLESYLRKHKFCSDCKMKVVRAYHILLGEMDPAKEKGFCSSLYSGIECCSGSHSIGATASNNQASSSCQTMVSVQQQQRESSSSSSTTSKVAAVPNQHIHINCDKQFIMNLILKAEPEIHGSRRERHAKTIDIAQEEVLTCIGLYIYERFHRIYQAMKAEEQTWQILFYVSVLTLKKCFELELERRSGVSKLDLLCAELAALDNNNNSNNSNSQPNSTNGTGSASSFNNKSSRKNKHQQKQSASQIKSAKKKEARQKAAARSQAAEKLEEERKDNDDDVDADAAQGSEEESSSCSNSVGNLHLVETEEAELEEEDEEEEDEFEEEEELDDVDEVEIEREKSTIPSPPPASASPFSSSSSSFTSSSSSSSSSTTSDTCRKTAASTCCECPSNNTSSSSSSSSQLRTTTSTSTTSTTFDDFNFELFKTADDLYLDEMANHDNGECVITDEEKNEYYANKSLLMNERLHRRQILQQKFQMFKLNAGNFQLRPRNVS